MEKLFVCYKTALKLKEIGFNEECLGIYTRYNPTDDIELYPKTQEFHKGYWNSANNKYYEDAECNDEICTAPTYQQVIDWFEQKYQIYITYELDCTSYPKYCFKIMKFVGNPKDLSEKVWYWEEIKPKEWNLYKDKYECLDAAILEAIIAI